MLKLDSPISTLIRLKETTVLGLKKLNILTIRDLLYHFPSRYVDASNFASIANLVEGETISVHATIKKLETKKGWKSKIPMTEALVEDVSGSMRVIWLHQPYLAKMLFVGQNLQLSGKVSLYQNKPSMINPAINEEKILGIDNHDSLFASEANETLTPIYPETKGISSLWFSHTIARALNELEELPDFLPEDLLKLYSLPSLKTALIWIHSPKDKADSLKAHKRFSFEEIFLINLARQRERLLLQNKKAYQIDLSDIHTENFIAKFPFPLTTAQNKAVDHILTDLEKEIPMSRLLEGDVGSGKTAVAAVAVYATVMNRPFKDQTKIKQTFGNLQVAYMAPTEILATQHFESFINFFKESGISIALLTGSGARKFPSKVASSSTPWTNISKAQLKKWIANGEIPIVIGTHSLIQKSLEFKHLALAIIDEQHRFGLDQRKSLAKKDSHFPHLLSMTATPIPRTLALTIYSDLDLSLLDQMPIGRKQPITQIIPDAKRTETYKQIKKELDLGRQLYVICPRINAPDPDQEKSLQTKSVTEEAARLSTKIFPDYSIGTLHSKMTKIQKEKVMQDFAEHKINILVTTSVVEVGVNVPNATMMIIEGAERFGLSQLHQLRGRVMRSSHQPYCYLFANIKSNSSKTAERLKYFLEAKNGFELAEYDLQLRGTGELTGLHQWGISDIGMEALRNLKLVEAARQSAITIIKNDPELNQHPLLKEKISSLGQLHFE